MWIEPTGSSYPELPIGLHSASAVRGPSELTPTVTEVIFVRAWFLPWTHNC